MIAAVVIAIVIAAVAVVVARLVDTVRNDRPQSSPRSHVDELDPRATRI